MASPTISILMTHSSISHFDQMIQRYLHGSQAPGRTSRRGWKNITYSSTWQRLSFLFPATPTLQHDFTIQLRSSTITSSSSVRNLGESLMTSWPSKSTLQRLLALHNIRKIRPFLTEHAAQLLVQALVISRLDYCNALLAGLPSNTIKPLQMIQNAAARLVFNEPMLHLSLSLCAGYRLQLASSSRHWFKTLKKIFFIFYFIFACLACTYLNKAWNWVLRAVPLSVCLFKMNRLMYSPVVSCFG